MFTLSEAAGQLLKEMLVGADAPEDAVLRIVTEEDEGLALTMDQAAPEDKTFVYEGRVVLVFNEELDQLLDERTLELEQTAEGPQLSLV